ncbi:MAG: hypothetical protein K2Q26_03295 [Bdellovibrionales bacterium]|nr:hypothetical protein [Bdellovibrionales bacterium]
MARKALALFALIIAMLVSIYGPQLFSDGDLEKRRVEEILQQGNPAKAKVIDKRIERIRQPAEGNQETRLFIVLEYEGQIHEQQFLKGFPEVRSEWEKVKIGDTVNIRVHPEHRSSFVAPDYLAQ